MTETNQQLSLVDSHCHLDMIAGRQNLDRVLERARRAGVETVITIGIDMESSRAAVEIARATPGVHATVGIHPHGAGRTTEEDYAALVKLAADPVVVGYGEIGMDLVKQYAPEDVQFIHFRRQLELARTLNLPVVIHDREAHEPVMAELRRQGPFAAGGVMHCFSGDVGLAQEVLDLGLLISIPGIVTFRNAATLQQVVRHIPLESMLLETDAPFLAPVPFRGKANEPAYLVHTAAMVAELKGVSVAEVGRVTTAAARRLFGL